MKKVIKLTESDLHNIVRESVKKIIKEWGDPLDDEPLNRWYKDNPGI